ncbi:unnamed protein product [Hymenolepis diminuta]|uniref:Uncharacterized protein n=1 Tax=Hymenolepis diminuta TaxID=6216 RepID=A0A564YPV2_HYMDI|nr:unnamed protein product [Hymenolepis diminuta]
MALPKNSSNMPVTGSCASSSSPLFLSPLPFSLLLANLSTLWSNQLLVICSTIVVSSYSNSHELVTVVAAISYQPSAVILTPTN